MSLEEYTLEYEWNLQINSITPPEKPVMLIGYLPEMRNKHFMKLIMKIGIVNFSSEFLVKLPNCFV